MERVWRVLLIGILLAFLGTAGYLVLQQNTPSPTEPSVTADEQSASPSEQNTEPPERFHAQQLPGVNKVYRWSAILPSNWEALWVPETEAIALYDPTAAGDTPLEQSQVFIRSFTATDFLTLQTVRIYRREQLEVDGHPAVRYEIEKRPDIPVFTSQPSWRSQRHTVTDVRVSDDPTSDFYVIAQRPDLADETYQQLLATFEVADDTYPVGPAEPTAGFIDRVTLKPFGLRVTPQTSPVQPERFSGYHTGADAEYTDVTDDVPVQAIADGTVRIARSAEGYGGVVAIEHIIDDKRYHVVYGHLDPAALPQIGQVVSRGDTIGRLGEGGTAETDGERKHLHLGVHTGSTTSIRGYVTRQADLGAWIDPLSLYAR